MAKRKKGLTKRQKEVAADMFNSGLDESGVLAKHKLSFVVYRKWLKDERFQKELGYHRESARRQAELIIARYATLAAAKLVQLADSGNNETARKACIDIITAGEQAEKSKAEALAKNDDKQAELQKMAAAEQLTAEKASRLLKSLAENV